MSTRSLQRVVVRLRHDPGFVAALANDVDAACAEAGLEPHERRWLAAVDPRAFASEPKVARSTLRALTSFAAVPVGLARASDPPLDCTTFFGSGFFHRAVQHGTSLAAAFCAFLARWAGGEPRANPWVAPTADVHRAMALAAYAADAECGVLAAGVALTWCPDGTLETIALLRSAPDAVNPASAGPRRPVLVERRGRETRTSYVDSSLAAVLETARLHRGPVGALAAELEQRGFAPTDARAAVADLLEQRLIAAV